MIAMVGLEKFKLNQFSDLDHPAKPRWPLDEDAVFLKGAGVDYNLILFKFLITNVTIFFNIIKMIQRIIYENKQSYFCHTIIYILHPYLNFLTHEI